MNIEPERRAPYTLFILLTIAFLLFAVGIIVYGARVSSEMGIPLVTQYSYNVGTSFTTTINQALSMEASPPSYAYFSQNNTIVFTSFSPQVVVLTSGRSTLHKFNITTSEFPSWVHGPVFVIYGHVDPTLVFLNGATVNFTVINIDGDMYHTLAMTQNGGVNTSAYYYNNNDTNIPSLGPRMPSISNSSLIMVNGFTMFCKLPQGTFRYVSLVPYQNQAKLFGMYGEIDVVSALS
ncbi:MAG: hypothetical protein PXY39_14255 [archaeon]|nr:hypothetical protein [archaeon]